VASGPKAIRGERTGGRAEADVEVLLSAYGIRVALVKGLDPAGARAEVFERAGSASQAPWNRKGCWRLPSS